jgi:hypothetical protein
MGFKFAKIDISRPFSRILICQNPIPGIDFDIIFL